MTHFRIEPPRINTDEAKQRGAYCRECLSRFNAIEARYRYGTKHFHKECARKWLQREMIQCG
jgi:hypothetical protein